MHDELCKFMALALLPADYIEPMFEKLSKYWKDTHGDYFNLFIEYYEREWIKKWKPKRISVYKKKSRTNNFCESQNKRLNIKIKKRPRPEKFICKFY